MIIYHQKFKNERIEEEFRSIENGLEMPIGSTERSRLNRKAERLYEKTQQVGRLLPDEMLGLDCVQSFVTNMSTATTLEELDLTQGVTLPEELLSSSSTEWTSPRWAKAGDIVFFMHSKTARSSITRLRSELMRHSEAIYADDYDRLMTYLEHSLDIHSRYGGKIFAIGRVCGGPEYVEPHELFENIFHWRSRTFSAIDNIHILENPIDISSFREYIRISRSGAITPLVDYEFDRLREDLGKFNSIPEYVRNAIARPLPLRSINEKNWIEIANDYRRCFILEKQFRQFYVDYLIREIGDQKKFFTECRCQRPSMNDSFMDYVMHVNDKWLPVETKLSVAAEPNIVAQVSKYVYNSNVFLTDDGKRVVSGNEFHPGKVLIIDTEKIYIFDSASKTVNEIFNLDQITSRIALCTLKQEIIKALLH